MTDAIKWKPVAGQMTDDETRTLGVDPLKGRSYHALWFFRRPLIVQNERGVGWSTMSKAVQGRALASVGLKELK